MNYYFCFQIKRLPDLSMPKYCFQGSSGQEDLMARHEIFLRQLHRLGEETAVSFHLLYFFDRDMPRGRQLSVLFYALAPRPEELSRVREFLSASVLGDYYGFYCYDVSGPVSGPEDFFLDGSEIRYRSLSGDVRAFRLSEAFSQKAEEEKLRETILGDGYLYCEIEPKRNAVTAINSEDFFVRENGRINCEARFSHAACLTKGLLSLPPLNEVYDSERCGRIQEYHAAAEWIPNKKGRLYHVLKLMESCDEQAAVRIDLFPGRKGEEFDAAVLPIIQELRRRTADWQSGRDDNVDTILKALESQRSKLLKFPRFDVNVTAFANDRELAAMLADSVGAESAENGAYNIRERKAEDDSGFSIYSFDEAPLSENDEEKNYLSPYLRTYTLDELRPMFSFPILYPGEAVSCPKETDPELLQESEENLLLGRTEYELPVYFPARLLNENPNPPAMLGRIG